MIELRTGYEERPGSEGDSVTTGTLGGLRGGSEAQAATWRMRKVKKGCKWSGGEGWGLKQPIRLGE